MIDEHFEQNCKRLKRRSLTGLALLLSLFCMCAATAEEGQWSVSSGADYSSGDYNDTSDTTMTFVPLSARYRQGDWSGKVSTGWLHIKGPGTVVDGGVVLPGGADRSESGIADTWFSLTYGVASLPPELGFLDVTGKLKIPTADKDKGLGTGEVDVALQVDYCYVMGDLTPMLTAGYKVKGDPDGIELNDVLYLSAGLDWHCLDNAHLGASVDYQQASVNGVEDPVEISTYLSHEINDKISLAPYFYHGLSSSSPDIGLGVQVSLKL